MLNLLGLLAMATAAASAPPQPSAQLIPTLWQAGHFFAIPQTKDGKTLRLLIYTGGGGAAHLYWLSTSAAKRLGWATHACGKGEEAIQVVDIPHFAPDRSLPAPLVGPCGHAAMVIPMPSNPLHVDGQLGASFLLGRIWTFDYPDRHVILEPSNWQPDPDAHAAPLRFLRDESGVPVDGFARIRIEVDGQALDMLLDTGASAHPTEAGEKASRTPVVDGIGVTSYITTSTLERWHAKHPDWDVVDKGDDLHGAHRATRIIKVPEVSIAGWLAGPIWFTEQPDYAFHTYMAQWMDKPTEGAVGANVFQHFIMTIDYPRATVYLRCVESCHAARQPRVP